MKVTDLVTVLWGRGSGRSRPRKITTWVINGLRYENRDGEESNIR
jgi:hypothetical protein